MRTFRWRVQKPRRKVMRGEQDGEIDAACVAIVINERVHGAGADSCDLCKWFFQNGFAIDSQFRLGRSELLEQQFFKPFEFFTSCLMIVFVQRVGGDFREGAAIMGRRQLEQWRIVAFRKETGDDK